MPVMSRSSQTKVPLKKDGNWILVRDRLNVGERNQYYDSIYKFVETPGENGQTISKIQTDPVRVQPETLIAHLVDWHLTEDDGSIVTSLLTGGENGAPMTVEERRSYIDNMDTDMFDEIFATIDKHIKKKEKGPKNAKAGESVAAPSSPSPSDGANPSNTSSN